MNHTIGYKIGVDFEHCEMHCYFEKKCVSVNYQVDTETCELNNATHLKYDENFIEKNGYLYHGADVSFCFNSFYSFNSVIRLFLLLFLLRLLPSASSWLETVSSFYFSVIFKPINLLKHAFFRDINLLKKLFVKSACDEIYCHNGGTCESGFTVKRYRCLCSSGYTGERCEKGKKWAMHFILIFFTIQILRNK